MRQAVNALRAIAGLSAQYSAAEVDPNVLRAQPTDEAHFVTLMANLNTARTALGLSAANFTVVPVQGGPVLPSQINELRQGVK